MRWLLALLISLPTASLALDEYIHPQVDVRYQDIHALLKEALDRTVPTHGPYVLRPSKALMTESRTLTEVQADRLVNIAWSSTSIVKEEALHPIRIPLRKGLLGYRIGLVSDRVDRTTEGIESLADLDQLRIGQGFDWGDVAVYQANGLDVKQVFEYRMLFYRLSRGHIDLFPRGVNEVFDEIDVWGKEYANLAIDDRILIHYPWPYYLFMSKQNKALADRVETGLNLMIEDGSFDRVFFSYFQDDIDRARLGSRQLIELENPMLPIQTPLDRPELWYQP